MLRDLPKDIQNISLNEVHQFCEPLSLYRIPGKRKPPMFLSLFLHGNESAGLEVLQNLLEKYGYHFPRETIVLIGNSVAAIDNLRHLDIQPDYNRIWKFEGSQAEFSRAKEIMNYMKTVEPFAAVDIHNNTGKNPHYICINKKNSVFFQLASLFDGLTIHFEDPAEVLSIACSELCPSFTIECGLSGDLDGSRKATEFVDQVMQLSEHPRAKENEKHSLLEVVAKIDLVDKTDFIIGNGDAKIILNPALEDFNFNETTGEEWIAKINAPLNECLSVNDGSGKDWTSETLEERDGTIYLKKGYIPSMLTTNHKNLEQDFLGYFMVFKTY